MWTSASSTRCCIAVRAEHPELEVWLEPGRYLVAAAGVLLARVTQLKSKGGVRFVGVATGMNSLIRPALYGAYHEIVNLTRLDEPATEAGERSSARCARAPMCWATTGCCRSTREGDVLLIANTGAYGRAMSSHYNLREPAAESHLSEALALARLSIAGASLVAGLALTSRAVPRPHRHQAVRGPALDAAGAGVSPRRWSCTPGAPAPLPDLEQELQRLQYRRADHAGASRHLPLQRRRASRSRCAPARFADESRAAQR